MKGYSEGESMTERSREYEEHSDLRCKMPEPRFCTISTFASPVLCFKTHGEGIPFAAGLPLNVRITRASPAITREEAERKVQIRKIEHSKQHIPGLIPVSFNNRSSRTAGACVVL
jgi:hypothetical protein